MYFLLGIFFPTLSDFLPLFLLLERKCIIEGLIDNEILVIKDFLNIFLTLFTYTRFT